MTVAQGTPRTDAALIPNAGYANYQLEQVTAVSRELEREVVELQKDAERWRWVRKQKHIDIAACYFLPLPCEANTADEIDACIDAAMAGS